MIEPLFHDHEKLVAVVRAKRGVSAQASTRGLAPKLKEHFEICGGGWGSGVVGHHEPAHGPFCIYFVHKIRAGVRRVFGSSKTRYMSRRRLGSESRRDKRGNPTRKEHCEVWRGGGEVDT